MSDLYFPWEAEPAEHPWVEIIDARGRRIVYLYEDLARRVVAAANATADPAVLALAEHLAAMDQGQRDAALDEIRNAIGDQW